MYLYIGIDRTGLNKMSRGGALPTLLRLARKNHRRLGLIGRILRPDGTEVGEAMRRLPLP